VTCCGVVVFRKIVVKGMLLCGAGYGVGIGIRVKWGLPRRGRDAVRCVAGVLFLEVSLYDVHNLRRVGGYVVGGWVSDDFEFGLVFGVGL